MSGLTWLHISDWHHGYFTIDPEVVRDGLVRDIRERSSISPDLENIDFIVFSGDAASSGRTEEYEDVKEEFFERILEAAGDVSPRRLFIVPGNHDLDEAELKKLPAEFLKENPTKNEVDQWLKDDSIREQLLRPFRDFKSFVSGYTGQDSPDYSNVRNWTINGKEVSLLGINSAWFCRRHFDKAGKPNDYGFARVGERQIHGPLEAIRKSDLRIAVLHHSQRWQEYSDGQDVWKRLEKGCHFILYGHGHELEVKAELGTKGDFVLIPAGAIFDRRVAKDPSRINSYNFVHLDFESGNGTVFLRCWNDNDSMWTSYDLKYPGGKYHLYHLNLPGPKRMALSPPSAPHRISSPSRCFVGRDKEIESILRDFEREAVIVHGMGGIGKTALALVVAEELAGRYSDGQIMVDMKGTDAEPLSASEAMAQIIRIYDPMFKPENEDELNGKYFEILRGKKTLLLLDDAAGREQVEPLLPPKSCALLATSRNRFALKDLKIVDLDVLPPEDAKKLLLELAARIGEHASELAKLCGYLPIALEKAAYAIKERTNISVSDHIKRLEESRRRLDFVEASFSLSYDLLTPELQRLWSMLSIFPADFDLAGAAAVWEIEENSAEDALGELIRWSLVDFTPSVTGEGGRYRLHDLARDFAGSRLDAADRDPSRLRHARHFLIVLSNADKLFNQGAESQLLGLNLFEIEWPNIQEGLSWAEICPKRMPEIDNICCDYPNAGASILFLRRHPEELIRWYKNAIEAAQRLDNSNLIAASLGGMANVLLAIGNYQEAIEYLESASRIIWGKRGEAVNLSGLGRAYAALSDYPKAIEYFEQALSISRKIGDERDEAANLAGLGRAYAALSNNTKAIEHFGLALPISRKIGDERGEAANLAGLGRAHAALSNNTKAIEYFELALPISRKIGNQNGEAANLAGLGRAYAALSNNLKAIECFKQALVISRNIGDKRGEAANFAHLGRSHAALSHNIKAIECFKKALPISRRIGDKRGEAANLAGLGLVYSALGDNRKAIEYFELALSISKKIGDKRGDAANLAGLGRAYAALGDYKKAIKYFEQALPINQNIGYKRGEAANLADFGLVHAALGDNPKAIEYYEQSLKISHEIGDVNGKASNLLNISLSLDKLGQREKAIYMAKSALAIFEEIESPTAETVRKKLAEWGG